MNRSEHKKVEEELREAIAGTSQQLLQSMRREPSLILEGNDTSEGINYPVDEIREWLFRRRQENGVTDNISSK